MTEVFLSAFLDLTFLEIQGVFSIHHSNDLGNMQEIVDAALGMYCVFIVAYTIKVGPSSPEMKKFVPKIKTDERRIFLVFPIIPLEIFFIGICVGQDHLTQQKFAGIYFSATFPPATPAEGVDFWLCEKKLGTIRRL